MKWLLRPSFILLILAIFGPRGSFAGNATPAPTHTPSMEAAQVIDDLNTKTDADTLKSDFAKVQNLWSSQATFPASPTRGGELFGGALGALTDVVVQNAENELVNDYFVGFENFIQSAPNLLGMSVTQLLPNSNQVLLDYINATDTMSFSPDFFLANFKNAFKTDLTNMPKVIAGQITYGLIAKNYDNDPKQIAAAIAQIDSDFQDIKTAIADINGNKTKGSFDYFILCSKALDIAKNADPKSTTIANLFKYGSFMVEMATSTDEAHLKAAIQNAVLPPGSSKLKKTHWLFLNSYLGGSAGWEQLSSRPTSDMLVSQNSFVGYTLPVGVEAVVAAPDLRFFVPLLDLGALASFRINDPSSSYPSSNIGIPQVFAPGAFAVIGHGDLALGLGCQFAPQLRDVTVDSTTMASNAFRLEAFLALDVPLITLK